MKRLFLLSAIAGVFAFSSVSAQTKDPAMSGQKLGVGVDFALPTGRFNDFYKVGYGGSLQFQTPIIEKLNFTASAGYLNFKVKGDSFPGGYYDVIPVKAGVRYFLAENFYAGAEAGAAIGLGKGESNFIYTPNIGVEFPVANKSTIDLGVRYESWSHNGTARFFGFRLAYNFGL